MTAIAMLMTVGMLIIAISLAGTDGLDMESARFGALYAIGSLAVSFVTFHVYRWLGRHEPPSEE
jgi:hypothetical protein